jgi:MFS family permease
MAGLPGLALSFIIFAVREPKRTKAAPEAGPERGALLAQFRRFPAFYACHFGGFTLMAVIYSGWNSWAPAFLMRTYGWSPPQAGMIMGSLALGAGACGLLGSGSLVDWLFRRGVRDAHFRVYVVATLVMAGAGAVAALSRDVRVVCAAIFVAGVIGAYMGVAAAALQIVTPAALRGRMSTIFLFVYTVVSYAVGPLFIPFLTEQVFHNQAAMPLAITWHFALFGGLACVVFLLGLAPLRRAMAESAPLSQSNPIKVAKLSSGARGVR